MAEVATPYRCEEPAHKPVSVTAVTPVLRVPRPFNATDAEMQTATSIGFIYKLTIFFITGFVPCPLVGQTCLAKRSVSNAALVEPFA